MYVCNFENQKCIYYYILFFAYFYYFSYFIREKFPTNFKTLCFIKNTFPFKNWT